MREDYCTKQRYKKALPKDLSGMKDEKQNEQLLQSPPLRLITALPRSMRCGRYRLFRKLSRAGEVAGEGVRVRIGARNLTGRSRRRLVLLESVSTTVRRKRSSHSGQRGFAELFRGAFEKVDHFSFESRKRVLLGKIAEMGGERVVTNVEELQAEVSPVRATKKKDKPREYDPACCVRIQPAPRLAIRRDTERPRVVISCHYL